MTVIYFVPLYIFSPTTCGWTMNSWITFLTVLQNSNVVAVFNSYKLCLGYFYVNITQLLLMPLWLRIHLK